MRAAGAAARAAAGWGGDRLALLDGPDGAWAVVLTDRLGHRRRRGRVRGGGATALAEAGGPAQVLPGEGGTVRWVVIGSDDADARRRSADVLGLAG